MGDGDGWGHVMATEIADEHLFVYKSGSLIILKAISNLETFNQLTVSVK